MRYNVIAATLTTLILAVLLTGVRSRPDRIQACGKELADLLQNTCLGGYNTYYHSNADENLSNGTRKKRGITQECCLQSCSLKDILQYCSGDTPVSATESAAINQSASRIAKPYHRKSSASNEINDERNPFGGTKNPPLTPPPPRLDAAANSRSSQEPHANVTPTSSGIHSKKPSWMGKPPAIVLYIGEKFKFGS